LIYAEKCKQLVRIVEVETEGNKHTITAEIPAFQEGSKYPDSPIKYIAWANERAQPPKEGAEGEATLVPTGKRGRALREETGSGAADKNDEAWQVYWRMTEFGPSDQLTPKTTPAESKGAENQSLFASGRSVYSPFSKIDADLKWRVGEEMWDIKNAIDTTIKHGDTEGSNIYATIEDVIEASKPLSDYYTRQRNYKLNGGLVGIAEEMGAVVSADQNGGNFNQVPPIKDRKGLDAWVKKNGWDLAKVTAALKDGGYTNSQDYLDKNSNDFQGLAKLIGSKLDW